MSLKRWLEYVLPPAVTRSWALAAGCPDEWLEKSARIQRAALPARTASAGTEEPHAPFDDVQ
jgi:hypothetical protein